MRLRVAIPAAAVLAAAAAHAQQAQRWSLVAGETVGDGQNAASTEIGWPGVSIGWTYGVTGYTDIGLRFDVLYAVDDTTQTRFGLGGRVPLRAVAIRGDVASIFVHVDPGLVAYPSNPSRWAFVLPAGGAVGFQLTDDSRLAIGMDVPLNFYVTGGTAVSVGTLFGLSYEYHPDRHVLYGIDTRFGPVFQGEGGNSDFGFVTRFVIGYR
jgi:hypothetical protein